MLYPFHAHPPPAHIGAARARVVACNDENRTNFLRKRCFLKAETGRIIEAVPLEEGRPRETIFDFVQGMTASARRKARQATRLDLEGKAVA